MSSKAVLVEEFRIHSIQEAALRVIARRGLSGTSMQAVAAEAGIAKGTIYLYFKSREDLVERTAEGSVSQLLKQVEPLLAESNREPFEDRLRKLIETKIQFFHEHREFFRIYIAVRDSEKGAGRECAGTRKHYERYLASLSAWLRRSMKRGEAFRADPDRLALFIAEGVHAVIIRRLSEAKSPRPSAEADWLANVLIRGLSAKGSGR